MLTTKISNYLDLIRIKKPIGILLLLWPTLWGIWLASDGHPQLHIVLIFVSGVFLMRSAGCIVNDIADRNFDKLVERTRERPITSGKISVTQASILLAILLGMALSLVLFLNPFTILLSFAGLIFACTYPWLKRVTHLPQLGLGICFSWGIPMAFAAQNNFISTGGWLVFLAAIIWPVIYDTQYALVDRNDDETIGVKSTAILFGKYNHVLISLLQMVFLLSLIAVGKHFQLASSFYISLILAGILFIYQFWLLHTGMRKNYFKAFLNNNWVGMIIFIGIILGLYQ